MTARQLRVVIDINVLISGYFFGKPETPPRRVLKATLERLLVLLHTDDYLVDLLEAFSKEKFIDRLAILGETAVSITVTLAQLGERVTTAEVPAGVVRDRDDVIILACAVGGQADFIVSGDKDLTDLGIYEGIPILTPAQFLLILNPPDEPVADEPVKE